MSKPKVRTTLTVARFREIKEDLKVYSVPELAERSGWSSTTLRRIKKARSLKQYREICATQ